ncbi:uncharacterized protein G2W53_044433 [Senna tora]|uniref:Retrotransposon gag domain-containing protein n=1 Tax=Senna tora TaxID=362788 RepID=A0A834VYH4_9FABA|nr:uncharacterized protein G2W53_044433 [Senna tora]
MPRGKKKKRVVEASPPPVRGRKRRGRAISHSPVRSPISPSSPESTHSEEAEMAEQNNRNVSDYATLKLDGLQYSIRRPSIQANNFEIKPATIQLLQANGQFGGSPIEDPNNHILNFLEICDTFKHNGVSDDAIRLRLFPFSLRDKAKVWLQSLPEGSITTWEELAQQFLTKYFPPGKTAKMRNDITSFVLLDNESLYEAWERFKELLRKCPHHGLPKWLQVQTFYNGLSSEIRKSIDAAAGGALMSKPVDAAYTLLETMSSNNHQWYSDQHVHARVAGVQDSDMFASLSSQIVVLTKEVKSLVREVMIKSHPVDPLEAAIMSILEHDEEDICDYVKMLESSVQLSKPNRRFEDLDLSSASRPFAKPSIEEPPHPREKLKKSVDKVSNLKGMKEKHLRRKVMSQRKKGSLASSSKGGKRQDEDGKVFIRGRWFKISRDVIRELLFLPDIPTSECEYHRMTTQGLTEEEYDVVLRKLYNPEGWSKQWELHHRTKERLSLDMTYFEPTARVWQRFIASHLLPSTHSSEVSKERAILNYCIHAHKKIDAAQIIFHQMMGVVDKHSVLSKPSLYFPCLITKIYHELGVQWSKTDPLVQKSRPFTISSLRSGSKRRMRKSNSANESGSEPDDHVEEPVQQEAGTSSSAPPQHTGVLDPWLREYLERQAAIQAANHQELLAIQAAHQQELCTWLDQISMAQNLVNGRVAYLEAQTQHLTACNGVIHQNF